MRIKATIVAYALCGLKDETLLIPNMQLSVNIKLH